MSGEHTSLLAELVAQPVQEWALTQVVEVEELAQRITSGVVQWQTELPDGSLLQLARLHAPLVQREEVFLGNVLLNDFLFKALPRAAAQLGLNRCVQVANDLDNAYFLMHGSLDLESIRDAWTHNIADRLSSLYFGDSNLDAGVHGTIHNMLTFYKCNIEPFPVFIIPRSLLPDLLNTVIAWLRRLLEDDGASALAKADNIPVDVASSRRINVILSHLSFFFCRDGLEMQSFYRFITQSMEDGRLPADPVHRAFGVPLGGELDKDTFNRVKGSEEGIDYVALRKAINTWLDQAESLVAEGRAEEVAPYLTDKMLPLSPHEVVQRLLQGVQLGYLPAATTLDGGEDEKQPLACRFCGADVAVVPERNIIGGLKTGGRFNQSVQRNADRFCVRCALSSYLENKRLGMQFDSGGFPVPKLYNVVFHYGRHDEVDTVVLQRQMDAVLNHAADEEALHEIKRALAEIRREVEAQLQPELTYSSLEALEAAALAALEGWEAPALDVAAQMQTDIQTQVLPLGAGSHRLLVFVLPQLRPGTQESMDFVQRRFSQSRLAAFTLLALLRGLCSCDGPYYFQSMPTLSTEGTQPDTFYVLNRPERASEALHKYAAITDFARRVTVYRRGHSPLADWVLLAEKLLEDPLSVFSDVLRNSPLRAGDDFKDYSYRRLSNVFVPGMGIVNSLEYLELFEQLKQLQQEVT